MICVITGSQKFQFNRLLIAIDQLVRDHVITEEVFAQIGYSNYHPQYYKFSKFLNKKEFDVMIENSNIVICHGGTGAIITAIKKNKKVIAIPRESKYGEHVDNHQLQIVQEFNNLNLIVSCTDLSDMGKLICDLRNKNLDSYQSNTSRIILDIEDYINGIFKNKKTDYSKVY